MKTLLVTLLLLFSINPHTVRENKDADLANLEAKLQRNILNQDGHEEEYLKEFCDVLVMGQLSDSSKVKVFCDWICSYLTYDWSYYNYKRRGGAFERDINWKTAIRYRKTVCAGYADLLCAMCETQGIDCRTVEGYGFAISELATAVNIPPDGYVADYFLYFEGHAWNVVTYENGNAYLIDPTWMDNLGDHCYFQTDPFDFLVTHYPIIPEYQLIEAPVSLDELTTMRMKDIRQNHRARKSIPEQIVDRNLMSPE